jgi:hypothetical protein
MSTFSLVGGNHAKPEFVLLTFLLQLPVSSMQQLGDTAVKTCVVRKKKGFFVFFIVCWMRTVFMSM